MNTNSQTNNEGAINELLPPISEGSKQPEGIDIQLVTNTVSLKNQFS